MNDYINPAMPKKLFAHAISYHLFAATFLGGVDYV